jgi:hypothetical protein
MRLIDADALKANVPDTSADIFENCRNCKTLMDWQVKELIDQQPTASPWHRVKDRLPEIGKIVLVYDDWDRLSICQLDNQYRWLRQGGGWFDVPYVRYWMPIPEPTKEGK